ncbi:MAG: TetR/AcrR family transcriptional regulator, partial [Saprospiraceae bacterium]|nr:TetR/AcrR family transcriptional regulator [Saprospiraceae bacterium]
MTITQTNPKRSQKENKIIDSAEKVFASVGFAKAKMEDVASAAGVSKGTVYFYFDTKENLYMAVTYRALQVLNDYLYRTINDNREKPGIESVLSIVETYINFCEKHLLYSEVMLDYMSLNRSTRQGRDKSKLTNALIESLYYRKVQDIQNLPINLIVNEIKRGRKDGSIKNTKKPELLYLTAWACAIGFI